MTDCRYPSEKRPAPQAIVGQERSQRDLEVFSRGGRAVSGSLEGASLGEGEGSIASAGCLSAMVSGAAIELVLARMQWSEAEKKDGKEDAQTYLCADRLHYRGQRSLSGFPVARVSARLNGPNRKRYRRSPSTTWEQHQTRTIAGSLVTLHALASTAALPSCCSIGIA